MYKRATTRGMGLNVLSSDYPPKTTAKGGISEDPLSGIRAQRDAVKESMGLTTHSDK